MPEIRAAHLDELSPRTLLGILAVRQDVFVVEQRCAYADIDARDAEAATLHLWIEDDHGDVVSTLRLLSEGAKRSSEKTTANSRRKNSSGYLNRIVDPPSCPGNELPLSRRLRSDALSKSLQMRRRHLFRPWSGFMG